MFNLQPPRHISTLPNSGCIAAMHHLTKWAMNGLNAVQQTAFLFDSAATAAQ